ncbi:NAD-dependent epimerase/dehydratase family protein [Altererythrobacter confluentis]|uniref:NAD-dependent epimerase/dehydratase family protein n=1 Tax=Allopontixanthobacter confluentis TaxID=1849021 RepID=A0A6L7GGD8_9SPHN|nr:SDR family oxidoreductase [Allopontixanthobacter confluentis]MXP15142.1 NAD-dependent epimerase/dehydratase family protein [Allopontixanthobacter confluentis]
MIVLVTGANGFVGRAIVNRLAEDGVQVRAAARNEIGSLPPGVTFAQAPDLAIIDGKEISGKPGEWATILDGVDAIVHCAARVHVMQDDASDPLEEYRKVNRDGTLALAQAAVKAGVKRFIFMSSIKVNGEQALPGAPFTRHSKPKPVDPYGVSKLEAENGLFELAENTAMEIAVIRPVLVYGPGVQANFQAIMKLVNRGIPLPFKSIDNRRSMIFLGNLADLTCQAINHPAAAGKCFLASDGEDLSTAELIKKLAHAMGLGPRLFTIPQPVMEFGAKLLGKSSMAVRLFGSLVVDSKETRALLDWQPPFSVAEGLALTAEAYKLESASSR